MSMREALLERLDTIVRRINTDGPSPELIAEGREIGKRLRKID